MKLLAAILLLASTAQAADWRYSVPFKDRDGGKHTIKARINGTAITCLFDPGANAYGYIWLQRQTASKLGLRRLNLGSGYHYYEGLRVGVGKFVRTGVVSYEYDASWEPEDQCLIGDTFFTGDEVLIDKRNRRLFWR